MNGALQQSISFHSSQRLGKHLLTDTRNRLAQASEAQFPFLHQSIQHQHGPLVGNGPIRSFTNVSTR